MKRVLPLDLGNADSGSSEAKVSKQHTRRVDPDGWKRFEGDFIRKEGEKMGPHGVRFQGRNLRRVT